MSKNRVALVTGGNRGIGLTIAQVLAESGHKVAVTYRSDPPPDDRLTAVRCDITDYDDVDQAFNIIEADLGPVEILVSNAGITKDSLLLRMSEDDFTSVIDTNLTASYRVAKRATKAMMKNRWGRIVFVSSVVGLSGQAGQTNYAASKAGLVGLGRSLAKEFASRGITVNIIAPGPVQTAMIDQLNEDQQDAIVDTVPLGRFAQPVEVAAAVAFLASENASYITGVVLPIDGGLTM